MGDNAVGFGFQGDVVSITSLGHLMTGRVFKALSDGGVDFYAVAASTWLGTQFTTRSALETTVHSHLTARKGFQGFLATTLSIGWGHSVVPVELSRTKAGTNALLLIGALCAGSSYYAASQTLSELLSSWGLDQDKIPNVDVLKPMVAYLAPFVQDLGFSKVLQLVTTSVTHQVRKTRPYVPDGLTAAGEASTLAAAIKQLVFTSQRDESAYLVAKQRGAWLAAFASHILGMSVDVVLDDSVVWASGGSNGRLILQLSDQTGGGSALQTRVGSGLVLVEPPSTETGQKPLRIDYAMEDALASELGVYPQLGIIIITGVHLAIASLSLVLYSTIQMETTKHWHTTHPINGGFQALSTLADVLRDLGVDDSHLSSPLKTAQSVWTGTVTESNGLGFLRADYAAELRNLCPLHQDKIVKSKLVRCMCCHVGGIIHGFASTAVALVQCRYTRSGIRLRSDVISGRINTFWSRGCTVEHGKVDLSLSSHQLFAHLSHLLHGTVSDEIQETDVVNIPPNVAILGISRGSYSIFYTCILDDDKAYDKGGRVITIAPGRASVQGVLRKLVLETFILDNKASKRTEAPKTPQITAVAPGSIIEPHYHPSHLSVFMDAGLSEHEIYISTAIGRDRLHQTPTALSSALHSLLTLVIVVPECDHPPDRPFQMNRHLNIRILGLDPFLVDIPFETDINDTWFFALKGRKIEQILQCDAAIDMSYLHRLYLQYRCCIQCAYSYKRATLKEVRFLLIMGG